MSKQKRAAANDRLEGSLGREVTLQHTQYEWGLKLE